MPITFNVVDNIIGEPDDPRSIAIVCLNSKLSNISTILPLTTSCSSFGYCIINISIFLY